MAAAEEIENWLQRPLQLIHQRLQEVAPTANLNTTSDWDFPRLLSQHFRLDSEAESQLSKIPSLNEVPSEHLAPNSLARFRCMVQDVLGPEYYMGVYKLPVKGGADGKISEQLRTGKYADVVDLPPEAAEEVDFDAAIRYERLVINGIEVPGESPWVAQACGSGSTPAAPRPAAAPVAASSGRKRRGSAAAAAASAPAPMDSAEDGAAPSSALAGSATKRSRPDQAAAAATTEAAETKGASAAAAPALPPLSGGLNVLVKLYDEYANEERGSLYKVGDIVEVIGVLAIDPDATGNSDPEDAVYNPPLSRALRLHCILLRRLSPGFPLLPSPEAFPPAMEALRPSLPTARASLLAYITQALAGDAVTAELLLLHMVSRVHSRNLERPIGKLALNLTGAVSSSTRVTRLVHSLYQQLLPRACLVDIGMAELNARRLGPVKDYETNHLEHGPLQVPAGTFLLLDETAMNVGKFNEVGHHNLQTLQKLINNQLLTYDFKFHQDDWKVDTPCLIMSEKKSIFKCDLRVALRPEAGKSLCPTLPEAPKETLDSWRKYLLLVRHLDWALDETTSQFVGDWFVALRKADPSANEETFHLHLNVARLIGVSCGETKLTPERWQQVTALVTKAQAQA